MPVLADPARAQFRLVGVEFEPRGPEWAAATAEQRTGYYRQLAAYARDAKYRELHNGIGVDGSRLPPRKHRRADRAAGPVLLPHYSDSRFRTMLRWDATENGAVLWWTGGWGRIVAYHAAGIPTGPRKQGATVIRDVVGLTPADAQWVADRARTWWQGQVRTGRLGAGETIAARDAAAVRQARRAGTFSGWQRVPPPREPGSVFAAKMPSRAVPQAVAPIIPRPATPWDILQRATELWNAAGRGRTTDAEIDRLILRLGNTQTLPTLQEVVRRLGVKVPPATKAGCLDLIRRAFLVRLRAA